MAKKASSHVACLQHARLSSGKSREARLRDNHGMLKEDLLLRQRAASGDADAAVELGLKYLTGSRGLARNPKQALTYLLPRVENQAILNKIVELAPLEVLIDAGTQELVQRTADAGLSLGAAKLGVWLVLLGQDAGWKWLGQTSGASRTDEAALEKWLFDERHMSAEKVVDLLLPISQNSPALRLALNVLLQRTPRSVSVRRAVLGAIRDAEAGKDNVAPLRHDILSRWLLEVGRDGSSYANFILGCAELGFTHGAIDATAISNKRNFRGGFARLLRAAHGGKREAWFILFRACSDYRSVIANQEAAAFFLEQAALAQVVDAQRTLAARILIRASCLAEILEGQRLLTRSAEAGDLEALRLLESFVSRPLGENGARARAELAQLERVDPGLAVRLRVAQSFGLSRAELLSIDLTEAAHEFTLVIAQDSRGYAIPAVTSEAKALLSALATSSRKELAPLDGQRASIIDEFLWKTHLTEEDFFAVEPNRDFAAWRVSRRAILKRLAAAAEAEPESGRDA